MTNAKECDCKETSCKENCIRNHTHKIFFCEKCVPVESTPTGIDENLQLKNHGVPYVTPANDWREELVELAEKYCKHDDRELNSCLYHIFEPFIKNILNQHTARIMDRLSKIRKMETPDDFADLGGEFKQGFNSALDQTIDIVNDTTIVATHTTKERVEPYLKQ